MRGTLDEFAQTTRLILAKESSHVNHALGATIFSLGRETPMTMQVGIRAANNSLVLASDTKCRVGEPSDSDSPVADTFVNHSKIAFAARHDIAVAMSGAGLLGDNPARDLADFLAGQKTIPDSLSLLLEDWGNERFKKQEMSDGVDEAELKQHAFPFFTLLVVNPHTEHCFSKLRINFRSSTDPSNTFIVNGHDHNAAIFWLEYLKADKPLPLASATGIAALTLLSDAEIHPYGVGGLEIHEWASGRWRTFTPKQIQATENRFAEFQEMLTPSAYQMSGGPL